MTMPRPRMTGAVRRETVSLGPRSMIHFAPESCRRSTSATQSIGRTKMASAISCASGVDGVGQPWGVEADLDLHGVEHRREDRAAADLVLPLGFFLLGDIAAVKL